MAGGVMAPFRTMTAPVSMGSHCIYSNVFTPPQTPRTILFMAVGKAAKIVRGKQRRVGLVAGF